MQPRLPVLNPRKLSFQRLLSAPHIFWGYPGVGKTACLRGMSDVCYTFIPSERLAVDLCAPVVHEKNGKKVLVDAPHSWIDEANEHAKAGKKVVILLDELTTASPDMEARMLSIVNERQVGSVKIDPRVVIVAAANPPSIAPGGRPLQPPMVSRMSHYWFEPDYKNFGEDFAVYWNNAPELVGVDRNDWLNVRIDIGSFLLKYPEYVLQFPNMERVDFEMVDTMIFPCPRSWDNLSRILAAEKLSINKWDSTVSDAVAATVGNVVKTMLSQWVIDSDIPTLDEVLARPRGFRVPQNMPTVLSLAMRISLAPIEHADKVLAALVYLMRKCDDYAEFIRPSVKRVFDRTGNDPRLLAQALKGLKREEIEIVREVSKSVTDIIQKVMGR